MVADTVMRYRQMQAALAAVQMLDWASIVQLPDTSPGTQYSSAWNDLFLDPERTRSPHYFDWFQTKFGDVPPVLRRRAVESVGFGPFGFRKAHPSRRQGSLAQILAARFAHEQLSFLFHPEQDPEIVARASPRFALLPVLLRLHLYDRVSGSWEWRLAAYDDQKTNWRAEPPVDDGAEMLPVPEDCAVVTFSSQRRIYLRNHAPLQVEPVLEILPFRDLAVPEDY